MKNFRIGSLKDYANLEMKGDYLYLMSQVEELRKAEKEAKKAERQARKMAKYAGSYDGYAAVEYRYAYFGDNEIEVRKVR